MIKFKSWQVAGMAANGSDLFMLFVLEPLQCPAFDSPGAYCGWALKKLRSNSFLELPGSCSSTSGTGCRNATFEASDHLRGQSQWIDRGTQAELAGHNRLSVSFWGWEGHPIALWVILRGLGGVHWSTVGVLTHKTWLFSWLGCPQAHGGWLGTCAWADDSGFDDI